MPRSAGLDEELPRYKGINTTSLINGFYVGPLVHHLLCDNHIPMETCSIQGPITWLRRVLTQYSNGTVANLNRMMALLHGIMDMVQEPYLLFRIVLTTA